MKVAQNLSSERMHGDSQDFSARQSLIQPMDLRGIPS